MQRSNNDSVEVECIYQCQTKLAYCVRMDEEDRIDIWLPKSMVSLAGEERRGAVVTISGSEEFLNEKGML